MINILYLHAGAEMYGADKVLLDLIQRLDKSKYMPYVILPMKGVLVDALRKEGIYVKVMPYPVMRRKYFTIKGIILYGIGLIKYSSKIARFARSLHIDIIHTNTAATFEGSLVSRKLGIPQLWSIHEIIIKPKIIYKITSFLIAKFSDSTITVSKAAKNHLENSGYFKKGAIKVIYNGVDSECFTPESDELYLYNEWKIPKDALVLAMIGRVNSWKGQGDFLQAANLLMKRYSNLYTVLVGSAFEGEEWREKELADAIEMSPYRERIINQGYRTDSPQIYRLCDVFVLPSVNPDPLPTVVLEAMSTAKPIVGYRHGGICEMVKEGYNGLLAEAGSPIELAEKIDILLQDTELRAKMGKNSRERLLKYFSIQSYVQHYSDEYDKLVKKHGDKFNG